MTIVVEADDEDGDIDEVRFWVDDLGICSATNFPYSCDWNTLDIASGKHEIKATAFDNDGDETTDIIQINSGSM